MIGALNSFIDKKNLCRKKDKILLAVSGGMDSIVMLDLFKETCYEIAIAHCNFKLRGEESDEDEKFVRLLAKEYKIDGYFKSFDTLKFATEKKCSVQEAARDLRYEWFAELSKKHSFDKIAVAHHLDDQVETFFINLFRGSGVKGLKGIPVKRENIIRPLLFAARKEVEDYCETKNLRFRSDSSNKSEKYLRNKIRHNLIPVIQEIKSNHQDSLLQSLGFLNEDHEVMETLLSEKRKELIEDDDGYQKIKIEEIKRLSLSMFYYLLSVFDFNRSITDAIFKAAITGESGKMFFSETHRLLIDRDFLILKEGEEIRDRRIFQINHADIKITEPLFLEIEKLTVDPSFKIGKEKQSAYFDFDKLTFPLTLRKWQQGDRFVPFGITGSKLVSDFLIDAKLTMFEKENVWVLLSGDKIIWVVGYRASNNFKIVSNSKQVLKLRLFTA